MAGTEFSTIYAPNSSSSGPFEILAENLVNEILSKATEQVEAMRGNNHVVNTDPQIESSIDFISPTGPVANPTIS